MLTLDNITALPLAETPLRTSALSPWVTPIQTGLFLIFVITVAIVTSILANKNALNISNAYDHIALIHILIKLL
jgi:hypothetical protein